MFFEQFDNVDRAKSKNTNIQSLQWKSNFDSLKVLFLGNSYLYSGIKPNVISDRGLKTYNLGIATAGPVFYRLVLEDYLKHTKATPEVICVLLSPMTFTSLSDNFTDYPIHRYLESPMSSFGVIIQSRNLSAALSSLKRTIEKGMSNLMNNSNPINNEIPEFVVRNMGYVPSAKVATDAVITEGFSKYNSLGVEDFSNSKRQSYVRFLNYAQSTGARIILLELPSNRISEIFSAEYMNDYNKTLEDLSERYKLISLSKEDFREDFYRDIDHLNDKGAQLATILTLEKLHALGISNVGN